MADSQLCLSTTVALHDGTQMPIIGLGTWSASGGEAEQAVLWAIQYGYRHIDTAQFYNNEADVGGAVRKCGIPRDEIFVVSKLWSDAHGYEKAIAAGKESLERLRLGYIDLLLMHDPGHETVGTWKGMVKLKEEGICHSIGVSNFGVHHLEGLQKATGVLPTVNQFELSPYHQRRELVAYCQSKGIAVEGYCPLVRRRKFLDPPLVAIAAKYRGKSTAQVLLRWALQHGYITIPKSANEERIAANIDLFDFNLGKEDMESLDALDENLRVSSWDPTTSPWSP